MICAEYGTAERSNLTNFAVCKRTGTLRIIAKESDEIGESIKEAVPESQDLPCMMPEHSHLHFADQSM